MSANIVSVFVTVLIFIFLLVFCYFKYCYRYWENRRVPTPFEASFPFGHAAQLFQNKKHISLLLDDIYHELKKNDHKHGGLYLFNRPFYLPIDNELVRHILVSDFEYFHDRGIYNNEKREPLTGHFLAIEGERWKSLRQKFIPAFTIKKLKCMLYILDYYGNELKKIIGESKKGLNLKTYLIEYSTKNVMSAIFGIDCNNSDGKTTNVFMNINERLFKPTFMQKLRFLLFYGMPEIAEYFGIYAMDQYIAKYLIKIITSSLEQRANGQNERNDLMQSFVELKNTGSIDQIEEDVSKTANLKVGLTINEIAAQAFIFYVAGHETSSSTILFCLYELSRNQDIQERVRKNIRETLKKYPGDISWETVSEMKYLDFAIKETLRIHPPLPFLSRMCVKDYKIPGTEVTIEKGTSVLIPTLSLHMDANNFEEPDKFWPDRFYNSDIKPCTFLPFGEGPRKCIAPKMGIMQAKMALIHLLLQFKFNLNSKSPNTLQYVPSNFVLLPKEDILFDLARTEDIFE